jgi:small nuclear ribonucleoprotein (snRNP)-like protein
LGAGAFLPWCLKIFQLQTSTQLKTTNTEHHATTRDYVSLHTPWLSQDALLQVCAIQATPALPLVALVLMFTFTNSFFKTLVDHEVTVELKNDIQIRGTLKSVDQYLNIKLDDIQVVEELKYPHLVST